MKKDYEKSDRMLGGYLPGGVKPSEVEMSKKASTVPSTKMNVFERAKAGVRTTFGIKELSPQEKERLKTKQEQDKAYKQEISNIQKQAWQKAYEEEHRKQILLFAGKQRELAMARGRAKAQQEVEAMGKPKQKLAWLSGPANALQKAMPAPSPKVQQQLDLSLGMLTGAKTATSRQPSFDDFVFGSRKQTKQNKISSMDAGTWDLPMRKPSNALQKLGTPSGGVNVDIDSNGEIILASRKSKNKRIKNLKTKLKSPKQPQSGDMFWKL